MGTAASSSMEEQPTRHPQLPAEIVYEVLLLLPVKSLKRFQCACKSWYSLISSPQFQKHHFRRAQTKPPLLLTFHWDWTKEPKLHFFAYGTNNTLVNNFTVPDHRLVRYFSGVLFMQSCLGLVCISSWSKDSHIFVLNPSTQDLISLPPTQQLNTCVGFGYAPSTEDFKVFRFFCGRNFTSRFEDIIDMTTCEVFTLGTTRWRELPSPPCRVSMGIAPFLHGAVHCLPQININSGVCDTDIIAVLDIKTEEYRDAIPMPAYYHTLGDCQRRGIVSLMDFMRLTTLGGSLCLTFDLGELRCRLDIWLLKDYYNKEWVKEYTVDVSSVYPYPSYCFCARPVNTMGGDILLNCSDDNGVKLLSYDPKDGIVTVKREMKTAATYYHETFYSLRSM